MSQEESRMQNTTGYGNEDRRQYERKSFSKSLSYCISAGQSAETKSFDRNGRVVDISEGGICMQTLDPLAAGHVLYFNDSVTFTAGIVRWCQELDEFYRAGIELRTDMAFPNNDVATTTGRSLAIQEVTEKCLRELDAATAKFNREMAAIEDVCIVQKQITDKAPEMIGKTIEDIIGVCEDFENKVSDINVIRQARIRFREKTDHFFSKSYCMNRTRVWPQGSQGDYKTLEGAYKNAALSEGLGYYLDLYMLDLPLARAVRSRIKWLEILLKDELLKRKEPAILNIACGACRELVRIVPEIIESGAKIVCIDSDNDAINYAQGRLSSLGLRNNIDFLNYNALRLFDYESGIAEFGTQDIIYSVGLFDYLPTDFLIKMFDTLYRMLNNGGRFIAAFKDAGRYRSQYYHWLVDWDGFLQRREDEFRMILDRAGIPPSSISERRDDTGTIVFYLCDK